MILQDVENRLREYDYGDDGPKWNRAAQKAYEALREADRLTSPDAIEALRRMLVTFGMQRFRMMYDKSPSEFEDRLRTTFEEVSIDDVVSELETFSLEDAPISHVSDQIRSIYQPLARRGVGSLHAQEKAFHVGATNILHFILPEFFIIVDSNTAAAFRLIHDVSYRATTQPGYSANRYLECLKRAQREVREYGPEKLRALAPDTPLARVFDKVAWVVGKT